MNVKDAILKRRTIRGYRKDPVPNHLLQEIFDIARHAPSNCNTQPWHLTVISGAARDNLELELLAELASGKPPSPAFTPGDKNLQGIYKDRQYDCAMRYYSSMEISRGDRRARKDLMLRNWQFFGAPQVAILSMPKTMGEVNALDVGIYLQTLMLLFVENGIACCPQGALAFYPDPLYDIARVPEENGILCGISFGYENQKARINETRMPRAPLEDTVTFVS